MASYGTREDTALFTLTEVGGAGSELLTESYRINRHSTPFQPHFNSILTPFQPHFNPISTPFQPHFYPILTQFQPQRERQAAARERSPCASVVFEEVTFVKR